MVKDQLRAGLRILALLAGMLLLGIYLENYVWIGQVCDANSPQTICSKKANATKRSYYFNLEDCQQALKGQGQDFVCARGPDANKPDETMFASFREIYFSGNDSIQNRNVNWSLKLVFLEIIFFILIAALLVIGKVVIRIFKKLTNN